MMKKHAPDESKLLVNETSVEINYKTKEITVTTRVDSHHSYQSTLRTEEEAV